MGITPSMDIVNTMSYVKCEENKKEIEIQKLKQTIVLTNPKINLKGYKKEFLIKSIKIIDFVVIGKIDVVILLSFCVDGNNQTTTFTKKKIELNDKNVNKNYVIYENSSFDEMKTIFQFYHTKIPKPQKKLNQSFKRSQDFFEMYCTLYTKFRAENKRELHGLNPRLFYYSHSPKKISISCNVLERFIKWYSKKIRKLQGMINLNSTTFTSTNKFGGSFNICIEFTE